MERLRVAIFSDSVLPILNGVSISVDALVGELRNRGHSVHLFAPQYFRHRDADPNIYRFRAIETPWAKNYPIAFPPFYRMLLKFRQHTFDIVHTHTPFAMGMVGLRWSESHELPIVSTYHTLYDRYTHYMKWFPRRYIRFRMAKHTNFYYNNVQHVITPSEASLKWLRRHAVNTPVSIIPTGSPRGPVLDRAETRRALGISPDSRVLLYVGRLAPEKNLSVLIEMAALAMHADPSVRLILVGDGPYRSECRRLVRQAGIGDRVRFEGFIARQDVDKYYAAADLFVFPSISETQGLVIQEAMMYGLPAVAVVGGGASDGISEGANGLIVRNDPVAFSEAVLSVLRNESLAARLSDGAAKASRDRSVGAMTDRVLEVYEEAIGRHQQIVPRNQFAWI
jgi:1,2-diacylglycerol 3-alpha-glucosyltransferase